MVESKAQEHACSVPCKLDVPVVDTCVTSGDGSSMTAAFTLGSSGAQNGVRVTFSKGGARYCSVTLSPTLDRKLLGSETVSVTVGKDATSGLEGDCPVDTLPATDCGSYSYSVRAAA
jgi:hypothetical protein